MAKESKAAASASAPRERLVWRVRKGARIPAERGPALNPGDEMSEDDPRFERWQSSLASSWEPVKAERPSPPSIPALPKEEHEG